MTDNRQSPQSLIVCVVALIVLTLAADATSAAESIDWKNHPVNRWVRQSPRDDAPAPGFYYEGSGGYDPIGQQWIHHAGHDGIPQGFHLFTWSLETGKWRQAFPPTSPPGVCCVDGSHVFDPANRRFVRFPGGTLGHGFQWSRGVKLKDSAVWLYDPAAKQWTNMRPPPYDLAVSKSPIGGLCAGAAYVDHYEIVVSFGGTGSAGAKNSLFAYDAYSNRLARLDAANPPEARDGMGLAYDPGNDGLVMFGSQYLSDERTWFYSFRTNRWESHDLSPRPPGKKDGTYSTIPRMAYDPTRGRALAVIWRDGKGHETWLLDTDELKWTKLDVGSLPEPSKSRSRNLVYAADRDVFILETSSAKNAPEIWTFRLPRETRAESPQRPRDLTAVTHADRVALAWKPASEKDKVKVYRLYRAADVDVAKPWTAMPTRFATTKELTYDDRGVTPGKVYFYGVAAVGADGLESFSSVQARTDPRVAIKPVVSVLAKDRVEVTWKAHPAPDITGYHVYRGTAVVRTVKKGTPAPWRDNDPEYAEPQVVEVRDVVDIRRLTEKPIVATSLTDAVDLTKKTDSAGDYKFSVHAYIIRTVNRFGVESGPSPYALTIPSEPTGVLCREQGQTAELKWDASPEKGIAGYHVYKLHGGVFGIQRVTTEPIREPQFRHAAGRDATRYWITAIDALGQEGQPSSPAWFNRSFRGFYDGEWHP